MNAYLAKARGRLTYAKYFTRSILVDAEKERVQIYAIRGKRLCLEVQRVFHI